MAEYKQEERLISVNTPLGADVLLLTGFTGTEAISRLFSFQLDMLSTKDDIKPADIVGKNVTFKIQESNGSPRFFNGFVNRFSAGSGQIRGMRQYRAEVVPWLWFLTRTADCRIFQNKTAVQIIEQIFKDLGFSDFQMKMSGTHAEREYCVQYRETDFNFVSRLCEEEGIFYFFQHEDGKHKMVLGDSKSAYVTCQENEVPFSGGALRPNHISGWEHAYEFRPGKWAQTDYNFQTPSTSLMTNVSTLVKLPGVDKYEIYDYPGLYGKKPVGEGLAKLRMEEEEAQHDVVNGGGSCKTFTPGGKFKLREHTFDSEKGKSFVVTAIQHSAQDTTYIGGAQPVRDYSNSFNCIPDSANYRPPRTTPKPVVQGPQTAVVTGPGGEEIFVNEYGQVKVQFHWDREGKKDDNSSCWIRVSQNLAGKNWGMAFWPRIGQEVIVDFLEGDPDRPIVTGRVYNAEQMPVYDLPGDKTQSGVKSRSSLKGSTENFNEICFEDKKGEELLYIRAEKDQTIAVENDEAHWVGHDRLKTVDNDETVEIHRDRTETVDRNESITIGANRTESVGKDETIKIGQNRKETVGKDEGVTIGGSRTKEVGKSESITIGQDRTEKVAKSAAWDIGGAASMTVEKTYTKKVKKAINIESEEEIVIKCGKAKITMKKDGTIQIDGKTKNVNMSGDIKIKGSKVAIN